MQVEVLVPFPDLVGEDGNGAGDNGGRGNLQRDGAGGCEVLPRHGRAWVLWIGGDQFQGDGDGLTVRWCER